MFAIVERPVGDEMSGPEASVGAAVGGEEDEGVRERDRGRAAGRRVGARELEQRRTLLQM